MADDKLNPNIDEPIEDETEYIDLITLADEDGVEHEFELADAIETDDGRYVALIPSAQSPEEMLAEDGELVIMKLGTDENGEEFYSLIEDDDEFYNVSAVFEERLGELYDFTDEVE